MTNFFSKLSLVTVGTAIAFLFTATSAVHAATIALSTLQSGDLVRGETLTSVYYYGEDGMRYVFPNEEIYFTWYPDFKSVKWISDADLSKIQIGGNVTYKPGSKLIKLASDPRLYVVGKNGALRTIVSETIAKELYGEMWNKQIQTLSDSFFKNYHIEGDIDLAAQYSPAFEQKNADSINTDKSLHSATTIHITSSGYDTPTIYIPTNRAVHWINDDVTNHSVSEWDSTWGSGTLKPGETFTKYFQTKGTWSYFSKYDEKSKVGGAIVVE